MQKLLANAIATESAMRAGSYSRAAQVLGILSALLALTVMAGWHLHIDLLVQLRPDLSPMPYNSALLLLLAGTSLWCITRRHVVLVRSMAGASLLFSALTISQYFTGVDLGIDQLLMHHYIAGNTAMPGRMALTSALCFMLLNTGFLLFTISQSRWYSRLLATVCAAVVIAVVIATMVGYKTNLQPLFGWSASTYMALQTALGLFMLCLGLLMSSLTTDGIELAEYNHLPMAAAGFIVIATATLLLWSGLTRQSDEQHQAALAANMRLVSGNIASHYREHISTLDRMARRWVAGNGTAESIWTIDAAAYLEVLPGISALTWIDANGVLQRKVSEPGSLMSLQAEVVQALSASCLQSRNTRGNTFTSPQVVTASDARFFLIQPLLPSGRFDGCFVTEFSTKSLFDTTSEQISDVAFHVDYNGITLYASSADADAGATHLKASAPLGLANGGWTLHVSDAGPAQEDVRNLLPGATLGAGLGLATLFSVLLGLWGTSHRHLTEASLAARALSISQQQLNQFRTTLDLTLDCVFMMDPDTLAYYYANEGALRLTGLTAAELHGKRPWDINADASEADVRKRVAPLINGEADHLTYDTVVRNTNGSETPVECFLQYIAPANEAPRFVAILRDITQRQRVERMKSEFVSTVSHELRTPLTSITGALGLIKGGALGAVSGTVQEMIDIAYQNGRRLTHLINDLLDIERIAAGKISLDFQVQPLMPLIEQALKGISTYGLDNKVSVKLVRAEPGVEVRVDNQRLLQILGNLLSNAIKFSPDQASVEVSVERRGAKVRLSVRDYGRGIPEEFKGRIFQKFAQADSSDTRRQSGTGLGLAISRELAERMGGALSFDSEPGQGTRFHLDLPISNYKQQQATGNGPRLLVVEDEPDAALLLQQVLQGAGYRTDVATTGAAALNLLRDNSYAALMLDLNLPDMHGLDIIRQLKAQPDHAQLPIIVISAQAEDGQLKMNGAGADIQWLSKPVDRLHLLAQLGHLAAHPTQEPCRVLHIEDDSDLHTVIRTMAGEGCEFTLASTLQAARAQLAANRYAAVILDLHLPDGSGWDLLPLIRQQQPDARLIIVTGSETSPDPGKVDSVLMKKSLTPDQLLAALHARLEPS